MSGGYPGPQEYTHPPPLSSHADPNSHADCICFHHGHALVVHHLHRYAQWYCYSVCHPNALGLGDFYHHADSAIDAVADWHGHPRLDALEKDAVLRATFFKQLRLMLYGGAGLSQSILDRLQACAVAETGCRIMMTSGYGMTETVSAFMVIHFETDKVGIGLPAPGTTIKLVPVGDRYELRARGPNVTKGYLDEPEKTAQAFDEEGFYRTGDFCVLHDPNDVSKGLAFAGRAAEEFKLSSGSWVYGGAMRDDLLKALSPLVLDFVLCDDNRPYLTLLIWPNKGAAPADIAARLAAFNASQHGVAGRIRRALRLDAPPTANAHVISDKCTINRRAVIERRSAEVERLYADAPDPDVILLD
jgi:feruloyl-CoA synthase